MMSKNNPNSENLQIWRYMAFFIIYPILKGDNKSQIPRYELSYFTYNFNAVYLIWKKLLFYFKKGCKMGQNSKISQIWKAYLTLEIVKQDNVQKTMDPAYYCVQHIIVSINLLCF